MKSIRIKAPAKINIGLFVTRKRIDGFHDIETVFYPLNLHDELIINKSDSFSFTCSNNLIADDNNNLVIKSVKLLEKYSGRKLPVEIHLEKNIPIGAGMGGGSSDAAAVLLSLNEMFKLNFTIDMLRQFGLELGSDVPFFIKPVPSFASSRGENLFPLTFKISKPILIINPNIHISTRWAYENITPQKAITDLKLLDNFCSSDFTSFRETVFNLFEEAVFKIYPEIKSIKDFCYSSGAEFSLMTGSGSTVFAIFSSLEDAEKTGFYFQQKKYFTYLNYEDEN